MSGFVSDPPVHNTATCPTDSRQAPWPTQGKLLKGVEPLTSSLPRTRSTTELQQHLLLGGTSLCNQRRTEPLDVLTYRPRCRRANYQIYKIAVACQRLSQTHDKFFRPHPTDRRPKAGRLAQRAMGIEPTWPAWKAGALPLSYARSIAAQVRYSTTLSATCKRKHHASHRPANAQTATSRQTRKPPKSRPHNYNHQCRPTPTVPVDTN